jgi:cyanophycinase
MNPLRMAAVTLGFVGVLLAGACGAFAAEFRYVRVGNAQDASGVAPKAGFALMGGGDDLDEAFRWLCGRGDGGDFLVLRATNNDEYNAYVQKLCHMNSVATLVIPSRAAATDPEVAKIITRASALFISGGDQANYINFWKGTLVQTAVNDAIRRGVPIGGTSAGLAVMGEWAYSAQADRPDDPNLDSNSALHTPYRNPRITLAGYFLDIPILKGIITDSHFAKRDRMGRLLVFLALLNESDCKVMPVTTPRMRGLGVDERAAVLLDADGNGRVVGSGSAYFIETDDADGPLCNGKPLTFGPYAVAKIAPGHTFNIKTGTGDAIAYALSAHKGKLTSTQAGGAIY